MRLLLFFLCLLRMCCPAFGQTGRPMPSAFVRGGVYSQQDSTMGVPGVEVICRPANDSAAAPYRVCTEQDGSYQLLVSGGRSYRMDVQYSGQRVAHRDVSVPVAGVVRASFFMDYTQDPSGFGVIIEPATVPPLFFSVRQRTLRPEGQVLLTQLGRMLRAQPALRVQVEGHADASEAPVHHPAPARYLQQLSAQRTATVANFLRGLGVSAARVVEVSYGTSQPAAPSEGSENRQLNRRVELELEGLRP